jgi:virulence factor Mce-like protein
VKRAIAGFLALAVVVGVVIALSGSSGGGGDPTYKIQMDNAFGLVTGADFKVSGVKAGTIKSIDLDQRSLHAVVTVSETQPGVEFHRDVFCISRPQSLIGEYFISCDPGTKGPALKNGATIPVSNTESTIPADLLQDVSRLPYRQRLSLIIGELGAAAAGRGSDIEAALRRAVPALTETDNLLNLLSNDSQTLQALTTSSDHVITALADNSVLVQRFIDKANNAAVDTATQQVNLRSTLAKLPGFLAQLRPAMARLGEAAQANEPVLANLNASSGTLDRFFTDLGPFSRAAKPAIKFLGKASVTGRTAVIAARPTVKALNQFAQPTPELAQNLAIVTQHLDNRQFAVEKNPRSPGGLGYTGLESLLQFVYNFDAGINTFGPFGHQLAVDAFVSSTCGFYTDQKTLVSNLKRDPTTTRACYSWLGPNQAGINTQDPSDPTACVPDLGGHPADKSGPVNPAGTQCSTSAQALVARRSAATSNTPSATSARTATSSQSASSASGATSTTAAPAGGAGAAPGSNNSATKQLLSYLIAP